MFSIYQLYAAGIGTTVSVTATGKGRIVSILGSVNALGGAAAGLTALSVVKNATPSAAASIQINNPQKNMLLINFQISHNTTTPAWDNIALEGIGIDYNPGDVFSLTSVNLNGTNPTQLYQLIQLYCDEK